MTGDASVCHAFLDAASFWQLLTAADHEIADAARAKGCVCGGRLHSARYPRKPRGVPRALLGTDYEKRLSLCCNQDGCRRRCTPPSVRYFGRRVYLGVMVTLATAAEHGLSPSRRRRLIEQLGVSPRTVERWVRDWRERLPATRLWTELRGRLASPLMPTQLPGALLGAVQGEDLACRLQHVLVLLMPLSSGSCAHCERVAMLPQKMPL